ncbi:unnamed protein product [Blepharisma stoltei]|uniref:Flavin reductase like domain-containing protein n=1 Tax=Blepharisma stoltei TaxID=1481888 RepID=A0AAU9J0M7_9CILI|nr:unnamed protein product [Blepharisma stoltei]
MKANLLLAYRQMAFPVGIITTTCKKDIGILKEGSFRGSTVSSFRVLDLEGNFYFTYNKSRIMVSALENSCAMHFLHQGQEDLALKFAVSRLTCEEQFEGLNITMKHGLPILSHYHSLLLCKIEKAVEHGSGVVYLGKIFHAEEKETKPLLYIHNGIVGALNI